MFCFYTKVDKDINETEFRNKRHLEDWEAFEAYYNFKFMEHIKFLDT